MNVNDIYYMRLKMPRRNRRKTQKKNKKEYYAKNGIYIDDKDEKEEG